MFSWCCDYCEERFPTYEQAMAHEISTHQDEVQGVSLQQQLAPSQGNENEDRDTTSSDTSSSDTAASAAADGTDNTTDSTHVVRVKQEDTTTTNDNTQQVSIKQEPMEDDNNTNNNNEGDNDELVNSDEKASCALKVLLDLDAGSLACANLREKIMKVQEVCNSDAPSLQQQISSMKDEIKQKDGIIKDTQDKNNTLKEQIAEIERVKVQGALVACDSSTKSTTKEQTSPSVLSDESDAIIANTSAGNTSSNSSSSSEDESNLKPAANPLIGSNVQVQSGKYKGAFGKVLSDRLGWVKIKPEYKLGSVKIKPIGVPELNVRIENCKLVNDGKADIAAIKRYFEERTRQMMEVIQPEELQLNNGESTATDSESTGITFQSATPENNYPYIHQAPSGKWTAQVYYAGKPRYIGLFCTQKTALLAQEAASEVLKNVTDTTDIETIDKNVVMARIAASRKIVNYDKDESDINSATNPLIGSTIQVCSGKYKGLSGKLLSESTSWLKIDNPNITTNILRSNCQVVDDGKADLKAIEQFCKDKRRQWPIMDPKGQVERPTKDEGINNQSVDDSNDEQSFTNPLIGSTMYIFSGTYKGLSGKLLSEGQSWLEIDNPNITKKVHCSYCQVIDDGKADLKAIEKFYKKRKWMPPIKGQAGRIKKVGGVDNQSKRNVHDTSSKEKRELAKLQDFNKPGLHYLPLERSTDEEDVNQSLRSRYNTKEVIKRSWDEKKKKKSGGGHFISEQPALYCSIPSGIATLAKQVKKELLERRWNGRGDLLKTWDEVDPHHIPGYFKGHMTNETSFEFEDCIPSSFELKRSATQLGIVFLNTQDGTCDTHFDRDSSILYLVSGIKIVKIAPPMSAIGRPNDGILQHVNPFSSDESEHGGFSWTTIHMGPGSSLFIPKYWLHCIKSVGNPQTLALSFQVLPKLGQISTPVRRTWTSQDISAVAEEQSVVDLLSENEDECNICGEGGKLICCDNCPLAYHEDCLEVNGDTLPDDWKCPRCVVKKGGDDKKMSVKETSSRKRKRTEKNDGSESTSRKRGRSLVSSVVPTKPRTEMSSSKRSSSRRRLVCGICNVNGFNQFGGREMVRAHLPMYITRPQNVLFDTHTTCFPTTSQSSGFYVIKDR